MKNRGEILLLFIFICLYMSSLGQFPRPIYPSPCEHDPPPFPSSSFLVPAAAASCCSRILLDRLTPPTDTLPMAGRVLLGERMPSAPRMRREGTAVSPLGRGGIASPAVDAYVGLLVLSTFTEYFHLTSCLSSSHLSSLFNSSYLLMPVAGPMPQPFSDSVPSPLSAHGLAATHD